jgi:hypothetical protein
MLAQLSTDEEAKDVEDELAEEADLTQDQIKAEPDSDMEGVYAHVRHGQGWEAGDMDQDELANNHRDLGSQVYDEMQLDVGSSAMGRAGLERSLPASFMIDDSAQASRMTATKTKVHKNTSKPAGGIQVITHKGWVRNRWTIRSNR